MRHGPGSTEAPELALIFPPLVGTSFGRYYPSLAALAGYLVERGVGCLQLDLNAAFADWLADEEHLRAAAEGDLPGGLFAPSAWPLRLAARALLEDRAGLFDDQGRRRFDATQPGPGYLLTWLAGAYATDVPLAEACGPWEESLVGGALAAFFDQLVPADLIPSSLSMVGLSLPMGPQLAPGLLLARRLKAARPELKVVLGGSAVSLLSDADLSHLLQAVPAVDAAVRFDGELPLAALVEQWSEGRWEPWEVAGVSCLRAGEPRHRPPAPGPALDALPYGLYDPVIMGRLARSEVALTQARGCYWGRCTYCDYVELYQGSAPYRYRTAARFADELAWQEEAVGAESLVVITEAIPPGFARRLSQELMERGLETPWQSFAMVDRHFDAELLGLMAASGCERLVIGVETMTDRVLELVEKHARREDNLRFIEQVHDAGIGAVVNLIPDLPGTTAAEAAAALEDFRSVAHCIELASVFPFEPTRSSQIGRDPGRFGLVAAQPGGSGQSEFAANHLDVVDPAMTDAERRVTLHAWLDFAGEVGGRTALAADPALLRELPGPEEPVSLAMDRLVFFEDQGEPQAWHKVTRQRLSLADGWAGLLEHLGELPSFTGSGLAEMFGDPDTGAAILERLLAFGLLARAG